MSDSEQPEAPPSPSTSRPTWPRATAVVIAIFTVVLALATLALVVTAIFQHYDAVEAIEATQRLAVATENASTDRQRTASAEFVMKIDTMLDDHRFDRISDDIDSHDSNYQLPKYTNKSDAGVNEYISIFENIGYFTKERLIDPNLSYEFFSYDIEKAWCNPTVQETIRDDRATDKSQTAQRDPNWANFERLAKE
jgi:hypothetical protein